MDIQRDILCNHGVYLLNKQVWMGKELVRIGTEGQGGRPPLATDGFSGSHCPELPSAPFPTEPPPFLAEPSPPPSLPQCYSMDHRPPPSLAALKTLIQLKI